MPRAESRRPTSAPRPRLRGHERTNQKLWDRSAAAYEQRNARTLSGDSAMGWGMWHIPERELRVLGDFAGKDILELGCGAARWSVELSQRGARMVALDFSATRLAQARAEMDRAGVDFPLVKASAESVPLPPGRFDIVFCDWGAVTFTDPYRTVPEAARLLRPGGLFAFSNSSPFRSLCQNRRTDRMSPRLLYDYYDLHRIEYPGEVNFQLPYGEWIRLFREQSFIVEDLIELRPQPGVRTTYLRPKEVEWARHWPLEVIWRVRKAGATPARKVRRLRSPAAARSR
ncbi:MAG: class I SAM-dependent methyltransferase [Thermoplasmata archaeon]|nr:class I SAM-dependent methyltransferase [Thermoplasmata archaeon]